MRPVHWCVFGSRSPHGVKLPAPVNGLLPLPASICAAGSWMVPAHAGAVNHASIPHVATKHLLNIPHLLPPLPRAYQFYGCAAGGPSQLKVHNRKTHQVYPVLEPKVHLEVFLLNSCNSCANSGVLRRLASSGSPLISSRE